jgi:hypothetical protein
MQLSVAISIILEATISNLHAQNKTENKIKIAHLN